MAVRADTGHITLLRNEGDCFLGCGTFEPVEEIGLKRLTGAGPWEITHSKENKVHAVH